MAVTFVIGRAGSGKTARCLRRITDTMRADPLGPPIYLIVPKQATFTAERQLTCESGLGAFCRARVLSFDLLAREVQAACGGLGAAGVPEVTPLGRQMILGHLLRRHQPQLQFFRSVARQPGVAIELDATFAEMERSGSAGDDLAALLDEKEPFAGTDADPDSLVAKLRDLRLLYDTYTAFLGQGRLDQHRRLLEVIRCLQQGDAFRNATVYVDGFLDFADHERRVLGALSTVCASLEVTMLMDPASDVLRNPHHQPDDLSLFYRTERAYQRLWFTFEEAGAKINAPVRLREPLRFAAGPRLAPDTPPDAEATRQNKRRPPSLGTPGEGRGEGGVPLNSEISDLKSQRPTRPHPTPPPAYRERGPDSALPHLERNWFDGSAKPSPDSIGLELLVAPDRRAEADAVARRARELTTTQGLRYRDVCVLTRDLDAYQPTLEASFREHGVAYFVDRRRTAAYHPLLRLVRAALQIARFDWPHEAVMGLLKTGLAGVSVDEADALEQYVLQHRIRGTEGWESVASWSYRRSLTLPGDADGDGPAPAGSNESVDSLRRRLAGRLAPLLHKARADAPVPLKEMAAALFGVIGNCGARGTIETWMAAADAAGDYEQRDEHHQVWAEFVALCEQMVDLLGDELVTAADFTDVLESGLERFDLALAPPTVDQVLIGQVDRTRTAAVRAVFVVGLNEGEFPRAPRDASILSDVERKALRRRKIDLDPDARRVLLDERLLGYTALTTAGERVIVSRTLSPDGTEPAGPSPFWGELLRLFPDAPATELPPERAGDPRQIATPRQLVVSLMRWVRSQSVNKDAGDASPVPSPLYSGERARVRGSSSVSVGSASADDPSGTAGASAEADPTSAVPSPPPSPPSTGEREDAPQPAVPTGGDSTDSAWSALYQWLATHPCDGGRVDSLRYRAWRALSYANDARLSPDVARELFPAPLQATAGRLETFAACPFRHYLRHGIGLIDRESQSVTALDLSQVYHQVLERLVAKALAEGCDWIGDTPPVTAEAIRACAQEIGETLRGELMLSSARNRYLLKRVERALAEVVAAQTEQMRRGQFRPARSSVKFGGAAGGGSVPALRVRTPGGSEVVLRGKIDRVDQLPGGGQVAVLDYRLGSNKLSLQEVYHGLSLHLLSGLLALHDAGAASDKRPAPTPAAAFYVQMVRHLGDVAHPSEALNPDDPRFRLRVKPRGVFEASAVSALDSQLTEGPSEVVNVRINKGGGFGSRRSSDVAEPQEFAALLAHVRRRLGELADRITEGDVAITPYRLNRDSPCPQCEFRGVCRFEPAVNRYRHLVPLGREDALRKMAEEVNGHADQP